MTYLCRYGSVNYNKTLHQSLVCLVTVHQKVDCWSNVSYMSTFVSYGTDDMISFLNRTVLLPFRLWV